MNTAIVKTYFKKLNKSGINSDVFFSIDSEEDVRGNAKLFSGDLIYVEGTIIIEIYGKNVLGVEHHDYPFWFWGQIPNQLERIAAGEDFEVPFLETSKILKVQSSSFKNYLDNLLHLTTLNSEYQY